jgi:hypothetical protein
VAGKIKMDLTHLFVEISGSIKCLEVNVFLLMPWLSKYRLQNS